MMDGDLAFWIEWAEERVAKGKGKERPTRTREGAGGVWKEVAQVAKCLVKKGKWSGYCGHTHCGSNAEGQGRVAWVSRRLGKICLYVGRSLGGKK